MADLELLRGLSDQVRPPAFADLQETARRRDRHAVLAAVAGTAVAGLVIAGGVLMTRGEERAVQPINPDPDRTQTVIEADYGGEAVHRFEDTSVSNSGDDADATDLSVSQDFYEGSEFAYWCSGDTGVFYAVHVTGGTDDPDHVGAWRAGGACDGLRRGHGDGYSGDGPPTGPTDSVSSTNMRFTPVPGDTANPTTVRIVLTDRIPDSIAGCFDLPGGPIPEECQDASAVQALDSPGEVEFGAVIFSRPVEYVATVAGIPVQAQFSHDGAEWLFARGVESMPGEDTVTLESERPGFVYVVQSDPQGAAACQAAYEEAKASGMDFRFEGDQMNWLCEPPKEAKLRLLVDGRPVAQAQEFPGSGGWQGWFDYGAASLDGGGHEITVERVGGAPRVTFGLVLFEERPAE